MNNIGCLNATEIDSDVMVMELDECSGEGCRTLIWEKQRSIRCVLCDVRYCGECERGCVEVKGVDIDLSDSYDPAKRIVCAECQHTGRFLQEFTPCSLCRGYIAEHLIARVCFGCFREFCHSCEGKLEKGGCAVDGDDWYCSWVCLLGDTAVYT